MNSNLLFNFSVDKDNKAILVERGFNAERDLVWAAWTRPEILDQWWAPKPYRTQTKHMDFREGGYWLYAMISPADEKHWCRADYRQITPQERYSAVDAFCDENGNPNADFPSASWNNRFEDKGSSTLVHIHITYQSLEDLEKIIAMGFKEGFSMGLSNLDTLLPELKK